MSTAKDRLSAISGHVNNHFGKSHGSSSTSKTELTSAISSIIGLNGFTKGGAAKRVFKPTIPARRSGGSAGSGSGAGGKETRDQNNSCNGKVKGKDPKSKKSKGKKDLIQLDATFNGINITSPALKAERAFTTPGGSGSGQSNDTRTLRSSQANSRTGSGGGGGAVSMNGDCFVKREDDDSPFGNIYKPSGDAGKEEVEEDAETIQRTLYRDDFVSPFDPNDQDMTPIGWEYVSQHQVYKQESKKDVKPSLRRFDKWSKTKMDEDKMVLFQLPEMLLKSSDGHVGKIRMYQSGKMELVDTRSGLVYDLLHTDSEVNPLGGEENDEESEDETSSEDNEVESKAETSNVTSGSKLSTDWIKKETQDEKEKPTTYDFLPPPPVPSTSKGSSSSPSSSYLSSSPMQSLSHSTYPSSSSQLSSKSSFKTFQKAKRNNRRNKCDTDEDKDKGNDDDDQDTDSDDDDDFNRKANQSYREACTFDGKQVVCLGPISNNQLLIGRPRLDNFINH